MEKIYYKFKMNNSNKINILDCTLRDGGYYNNWEFSRPLIKEYLKIITLKRITHVELGFRSLSKNATGGITAKTTDEFINSLNLPKKIKFGVMVNVSDFTKNRHPINLLKKFFKPASKTNIDFIRLACHIHDVYKIGSAVNWLKKNGYVVFLNIMQISEIKDNEIKKISFFLKKIKIDIIYLADSLGCIKPNRFASLFRKFKLFWRKDLGIHAHDNLGFALQNSKTALKNGANWVDCTVTGMGRGPGNLKTEKFLKEISKENLKELNKLIKYFFLPLKKKYKWGKNKYYKIAAENKIHPTYIQDLLSDDRYKKKDYLNIIEILKKTDSRKFNPYQMYSSEILFSGKPKGLWSPKIYFKNKDILILGPGKSVINKKSLIEKLIKDNNLIVLAINTTSQLEENLINMRVVCHPMRIVSDSIFHKNSRKGLITPFSMMPTKIQNLVNNKNKMIYDFGITINSNEQIIVNDKYCSTPKPLAISYALSVAISGKARRIYLAGFDGFEKSDPFKDETNEILKLIKNKYKNLYLKTLTTSKYKIEKVSIN